MRERPQPGDKYIDSRDVIKAIEELEGEREALMGDVRDAATDDEIREAADALSEWEDEYGEELAQLRALHEDCDYGDWTHGVTLILDSEFEDHARDLACDMESIKHLNAWPYRHIDWGEAADELKSDYAAVQFGEYEYWIRQ